VPENPYVPPEFPLCSVRDGLWARQGDIYRDVEYIESLDEDRSGDTLSISKLAFPLALVLGQDCDLLSDEAMRTPSLPPGRQRPSKSSAIVLTVLMTPLYNAEEFFAGIHCSDLTENLFLGAATQPSPQPMQGTSFTTNGRDPIKKGENARYQYLHFSASAPLVDCVIDFKHYFSVKTWYLVSAREQCVGRIGPVFRESISQRFSYYLSRIGLPDAE
jgi:hypothetical protein